MTTSLFNADFEQRVVLPPPREEDWVDSPMPGVTLPITEGEACLIVSEPFLYYFSTALRIHTTIDRIKEGQPEDEATSTGKSNDKESEEVVS